MPLKEIAKSSLARFEWWIQTKFTVLATDDRFLNLTDEQKDLMYEHYLIDNPAKESDTKDEDYDNAQTDAENEAKGVSKDTDYLPFPEEGTERFADPDFDSEWDTDEEDSDSDSVEENSSESDFEALGEENGEDTDFPKEDDSDEWEKV